MEENYFDVDTALKEHSAEKVAEHLAKLHGIDREAYLKDGMTDSQFLNEFKSKALPVAETQEETAPKSHLEQPNIAVNVLGGGAAAAVPAVASYGANKILSGTQHALGLKPRVAAPSASPVEVQKQFVSPEAIEQRILESGKPPRPQGPGDVVNWALGKTPESGQYGRGYLGGQSQAEEAALHAQADALEKANPGMKIKQGTTNLLIPEAEYNRLLEEKRIADLKAQDELSIKAKQAAELRANRLAEAEPSTGNKIIKGVTNIAKAPVPNRFALGYNAMDALQAQNPFEAGVSTAGALSPYVAPKIAKMLPKKYRNIVEGVGSALPYAAPAINALERKLIAPKEEKAAGGLASLFSGGAPQQKAAGGLAEGGPPLPGKLGKAVSLAQKAAHELHGQTPGRMTDWLQHNIGKFVVPTQSDRMGGVGGPSFSANSLALPEYKGKAWGSGNEGTATAITNLAKDQRFGGPENQIFVPMLGHQNQHKSNQIAFDRLMKDFYEHPEKLTPELRAKINDFMRSGGGIDKATGQTNFPMFTDFDIANKTDVGLLGRSFDNRGLIAQHGFGGERLGGKKSQIFPYQQRLDKMADPTVAGAPTFAVGPRAFQLTGNVHPEPRPDLNAAFPYLLEGHDLNVAYRPVENSAIFQDFQNQWRQHKGKNEPLKSGKLPEPGYYENTIGYKVNPDDAERIYPRQEVTEQLLDSMYKKGFAPGGKVMKAAVEEFKKKFTPGFYHGSPSPNITAFDPTKSTKDPMYITPKATFVTRDPEFAESFLSMNNSGKIKSGSTMYPVNVNLGQHWNPNTPEGQQLIQDFIEKYPKRVNLEKGLKRGDWTAIENSDFLSHLKDTGHDTFHVVEGGIPNVGVLNSANIRGKFAKYNPEDAESPDFMKAAGGLIHLAPGGKVPEAVVKAYKLFRTKGGNTDELYPLFVNANKPVPMGEWVPAEVGPVAASGKVKSKLGELAYRPGWHAGDLPIATHIGGKSSPTLKAPDFRRPDEVWAEVEMPNDVDWQTIANQRAALNKAGQIIPRTAHITDEVPFGGHYRYKTSPNMQGNWLIGGDMKVNRVLTDEEVQAINEAAGAADLPRFTPLK